MSARSSLSKDPNAVEVGGSPVEMPGRMDGSVDLWRFGETKDWKDPPRSRFDVEDM